MRGTAHEVSTYEAAPHSTVKGVIRGIPLKDVAQEIQANVVHKHNPTALQANRIGKIRSVIAFEGHKVPNYVRYGNQLTECTLHRKQINVCYACGRVGHRMDVCPDPLNTICRGCRISKPDEDHGCVPKCGLYGGKNLTADKACKARFKTPYVVRQRRWERRRAEEDDAGEGTKTRQVLQAEPAVATPSNGGSRDGPPERAGRNLQKRQQCREGHHSGTLDVSWRSEVDLGSTTA
ncbi:hypothetical protein V5799_012057 [Amblyomma americanum]|uniref:CCHC-type domain-containing protein n=1 Tax=Amblyomma americanum TaxID=6943 RepID=A0AAQ4EFF5_AMBAM